MRLTKSILLIISLGWICFQFVPTSSYSEEKKIAVNNNFVSIYKNIFEPSCSKAGCHDGSFEPDFRTLQSSYSTLVLHPLIKNNRNATFKFRVIPYDTAGSVLYERITNCCFVDQNDRMPFYDKVGLSKDNIELIAKWIMEGAPDIFGEVPLLTCTPPAIKGHYLYGVNKKGESQVINEKVMNKLGEVIAVSVNRNFVQIGIVLQVNSSITACPIDPLNNYTLNLYKDINYTQLITRIPSKFDITSSIFDTKIPLKIIPIGTNIFFRLENPKIPQFSYPNTQILEHLRYGWALKVKKK